MLETYGPGVLAELDQLRASPLSAFLRQSVHGIPGGRGFPKSFWDVPASTHGACSHPSGAINSSGRRVSPAS